MNAMFKTAILLWCVFAPLGAFEVLAVVNGKNITTDVAPKDFKTLNKKLQKTIIKRLIEKRLACDWAMSLPIVKSKEYKKALKHILRMNKIKDKKRQDMFLADVLKDNATLKGYTTEQLYSKKGLLAFDFAISDYAKKIKIDEVELKKYYQANKYKYDTPAMKELFVIVVDDYKRANDIIDKVSKSKDRLNTFERLAVKYSLAPSAHNGGYFGKIPTKEINDKLKPFLKNLKRSEITHKPIKTEFGYQIFYCLNDIPRFDSKLELIRSKVESDFIDSKVKQFATLKIEQLAKSANIVTKYNTN